MLEEPKWGARGLQAAKYLSAICTARFIILITPPLITVTQICSSAEKLMFSRDHHVQGYMKHNNVIFLQKKRGMGKTIYPNILQQSRKIQAFLGSFVGIPDSLFEKYQHWLCHKFILSSHILSSLLSTTGWEKISAEELCWEFTKNSKD